MFFLTSCNSSRHFSPSATRFINVDITTTPDVNLNAKMQAQPIKICIIEVDHPGWLPEGTSDGTPCQGSSITNGVILRNQTILLPHETRHYHFEVSAQKERWIVMGAEFQKLTGILPIIEKKSPALANSTIKINVGNESLSVVTNNKYR